MPLQVTFTNPFLKRLMFSSRVNARAEHAASELLRFKNKPDAGVTVSDETKLFIMATPFAEKLNKLRANAVPSTKYNLDPLDIDTADYKLLKRYINSARLRVPLKVQNTISTVINNLATEYLSAVHAATHMNKLATVSVLRDELVSATLLGRLFESIPEYAAARSGSVVAPLNDTPDGALVHIRNTMQRAYKHTHSAQTARGAKMDDPLSDIVAYSLYAMILRFADALTHINNATSNKTIRNDIVRTMYEVHGLLFGCVFGPYFKAVEKADESAADDSADSSAPPELPRAPSPKPPASSADDDAGASAAPADDAGVAAADESPAKRRRKSAKK